MPSRSEVRVLQRSQVEVAQMARNELAGWWATIDKSDLNALRAEVERFFPMLIEDYGEVASTAAADWYDQIYRERPRLSQMRNEDIARARARWALGHAFQGDPDAAIGALKVVAAEMVREFGRDTIISSAGLNKRMFGRVPAGSDPCAWCLMLASRGFAYHSEEDAKPMRKSHYGECNCEVVPDDGQIPEGYDPDAMYKIYESVHARFDNDRDVAQKLRHKYGLR